MVVVSIKGLVTFSRVAQTFPVFLSQNNSVAVLWIGSHTSVGNLQNTRFYRWSACVEMFHALSLVPFCFLRSNNGVALLRLFSSGFISGHSDSDSGHTVTLDGSIDAIASSIY